MRPTVAITTAVLALTTFPSLARACKCAPNPTADAILASAASVFTGTVRAVETIAPGQSVTTFVVREPFKGAPRGAVVNVHHVSGPAASCGVTFAYGESYTIAASLERGALWTSRCSTWMFLPGNEQSGDLIARMRSLRRRQ